MSPKRNLRLTLIEYYRYSYNTNERFFQLSGHYNLFLFIYNISKINDIGHAHEKSKRSTNVKWHCNGIMA